MTTRYNIPNPILLRRVLLADAALTGITALAMCLATTPLATLTQLPSSLLSIAGFILLPFVAWVAWLVRQPSRRTAWTVVSVNALWAVDCLLLLASGWVSPNTFGTLFVLVQALTVTIFAVLGYQALTKPARAAFAS